MKLFIYFVGSLLVSSFLFTQQAPEQSPQPKKPELTAEPKKKLASQDVAEKVATKEPEKEAAPKVDAEKLKDDAAQADEADQDKNDVTDQAPDEESKQEPASTSEQPKEDAEEPEDYDAQADEADQDKKEVTVDKTPTKDVTKEPAPPTETMPEAPPEQEVEESKSEEPAPTPSTDEVKEPTTAKEAIGQAGIDTVDLEGGNWLLKRQALEKALDLAEGINEVFSIIVKTRMNFVTQRNSADKKFDEFIGKIGFELGELIELINSLIDDLESERTREGALTEEEREALDELNKKLDALNQMKEDLKALSDLDNSIDDVLIQVEKEIDRASAYQKKGWANVQEIKKVLSDEKAEELYVRTSSLLKNSNDIKDYLVGKLSSYMANTVSSLEEKMNSLQEAVTQLKKEGLDLKEEIKKFIDEDGACPHETSPSIATIKQEPKSQTTGWFSSIAVIWRYPLQKFADLWHWIMSIFS